MLVRYSQVSLVCAALVAIAGCTINIPDGNTNSNDNANSNNNGGDSTIRVRVVNSTGATIDPEIYVTGSAVTDPAQLFSADRKFTHYGVGTRGLLGNFDQDEFTLDCSTTRVIGTKGGLFGDNLDSPDGVGQQRILTQDVTFVCGDVLVFTFSKSGNTFSTTVSLSR